MIGHYVDTLSPAAEDRVLLTSKLYFAPAWINPDCSRCLVGAAADMGGLNYDRQEWARQNWTPESFDNVCFTVGSRYDSLVQRFGERLNAAIRNRILANQARRLLAQPVAEEAAWVR